MTHIYDQVIRIFYEVGKKIRTSMSSPIHYQSKARFNFVSAIDIEIQTILIESLSSIDSSWTYLCEESTSTLPIKNGWIIDPIDGTTNLLHHYPHFAISAAYVVDCVTQFAIIYNPMLEEMYTAILDNGAYLNGLPIHVSSHTALSECLLGVGFPYDRALAPRVFSCMGQLYNTCQDIKRKGSAALDLAYVASGRLDGYFELELKPWDIAAGILLIKESGGIVENHMLPDGVSILIASNNHIQKDFKNQIFEVLN